MRYTIKPFYAGPSLWVMAYYLGYYWDWITPASEAIAAVDMTTMTDLLFCHYCPGGGSIGGSFGQLVPGAGTGHQYVEQPLIDKAHDAGVSAIMMIGGAQDGPGWVGSTVDAAMRAVFIANILDKCEEKDYDGVDVDWEENISTQVQRDQCLAFLSELRAAAWQRERWQPPYAPFRISFPTVALNMNTDSVPAFKVQAAALVDRMNLMSYNMHYDDTYGWSSWFFGALDDGSGTHPMSITGSLNRYVAAGVPRAKLGMGIGLYGGGYKLPITGMRQTGQFSMWGNDDDVDTWSKLWRGGYGGIYPGIDMFNHPNGTYVWDEAAKTGFYVYDPVIQYRGTISGTIHQVSVMSAEDVVSIAAKGAFAKGGGCGGTIVWTQNYGNMVIDGVRRNIPMEAIRDAFLR